ncbi:cytochrome b [Microvirga terricola]|uniref:Cytochrome b n=1 Tax=Microvirga terricola TaxID=2719797 RepID=A0ABX0V7S6_9HYPH|nr:cytochrome b [Microvirga terricola]NIX75633.1 cytochrome b [Microvirga terricola]
MTRYPRALIVLHWLVALLIVAAWFTGEGGRSVRANPPVLHFAFGLSVLTLVVPRLLIRLFKGTPALPESTGPFMKIAAKLGHGVLYLFMIGLPLSGWYAASRMGVPVTLLGYPLPNLTSAVQGPPGLIGDLHETGGTIILILAGLHALVALWHHFVLRDGLLKRMSLSAG